MEACEFRQNFLHLRPAQAVILNIEPDHFDCYDTQEALESAFATFCGPAAGRRPIDRALWRCGRRSVSWPRLAAGSRRLGFCLMPASHQHAYPPTRTQSTGCPPGALA